MTSGVQVNREVIHRLLRRQHRPLSARRLFMLSQQEFDFEGNYGEVLSSLKRWVKNDSSFEGEKLIEVRRGVFGIKTTENVNLNH